MKNYETILASKDAEIAELKRQLRLAQEASRRFWEEANVDEMTHCFNRNFFNKEFEKRMVVQNFPYVLFMADLNGLKKINDTYGHDIGDEYIITAANVMRESLPDEAQIIRLGGDEFVIAVPNCNEEKAQLLMLEIALRAAKTTLSNGEQLSISVGHAIRKNVYVSTTEILKKADEEMYENKRAFHAAEISGKVKKLAI